MRYKEPFSYYKRKTKSGKPVYYYRAYDEAGRRTSGISTGCTTLTSFRTYMAELIRKGEFLLAENINYFFLFWLFFHHYIGS